MTGTYIQAVTFLAQQNAIKPTAKWDIREHKDKRSLSQNAYYWKLISEVSRRKRQSVAYTHNHELREARYARWIGDEPIKVRIPDTDAAEAQVMEQTEFHLAPTKERDGDKRIYVLLRGSSEFNTAEMSHLLDLLIQDAQALGIETLSPDELARIRAYEQEREDARADKAKPDPQEG